MSTYHAEVQISRWPEGGFLAEAIGLEGCWVVSETVDQTIDDIREAIQFWIRVRREHGWALPSALTSSGKVEDQAW